MRQYPVDEVSAHQRPPRDSLRHSWLDITIILVTFISLLVMAWRRSAHFLVDFGRELYVAWQVAEGQTLYRDLAYFNGPLSPHFNGLVFRLLGESAMTLMVVNSILLLLVVALLYIGLGSVGGRLARLAGCVFFLAMFAISDVYQFGNYNFITPYSHEMTHGFLLALVTLLVLAGALRGKSTRRWLATGLCIGLVFLTKAEILLATAGAVGIATLLAGWQQRTPWREIASRAVLLVLGASVPILLSLGFLATRMTFTEAVRGTLGSWVHVFNNQVGDLRFYKLYMGTLDLPNSLLRITVWAAYYLVAFGPVVLAAKKVGPRSRHRIWVTLVSGIWVSVITLLALNLFMPEDLLRPLPLLLPIAIVGFWRSDRGDKVALVTLSTFALLMLIKIFFFTRVHHYGFVLAIPAFMVLVLVLLDRIPGWIERQGGTGSIFQTAGMVLLVIYAVVVVRVSAVGYKGNDVLLGQGSDQLIVAEKGKLVAEAIEWLQSDTTAEETLAVFPEGAMVNYQARRANSTPYFTLLPPEILMFGQETIVSAYDASPPDVVVVVKRTTKEYGFTAFGNGYAEDLDGWIRDNYEVVHSLIEPEFEPDYSRVFILRRKQAVRNAQLKGGAQVE
jgi:4-amino-4-deoxy-L-arabinose transferase-like glycosyltransferase